VRAGPGAGDDEPFGGEGGERAGDGHGADMEPLDQGPTRWQLLTFAVAVEFISENFCQFSDAVTLMHDCTR
ncbi:hypothetical protein ADK38_36510, partial [Streptomyces varsoviensis]